MNVTLTRSVRRLACIAVLVLSNAAAADALVFDLVDTALSGGRRVRWIRDCGTHEGDRCTKPQTLFWPGDSERLAPLLRDGDEVWMDSGGGDLNEGILIGELLRRRQATVRVPPGASCVSSCTVAFLGGVFRYVESGGSYEVHAASKFLNESLEGDRLQEVVSDPRQALADWAARLQDGYTVDGRIVTGLREIAMRLFRHFQRALLPLGEFPAGSVTPNDALDRWFRNRPAVTYGGSAQHSADVEKITREGGPAAQEVLMRMERDTVAGAIASLRAIETQLGPRADPALDMLETMYSSRITLTLRLNYETLLKMGFITRDLKP